MLNVVTHPAEMHESPARWMSSLFNNALYMQTLKTRGLEAWILGTNSQFSLRSPNGGGLKVYTPDAYMGNGIGGLLLVLEVAHTQTMKDVLCKVKDVWVKIPNICGVIVIKMEEIGSYNKPADGLRPIESILTIDEWMAREFPPGEITYDGHSWIGEYFFRILVFVNTQINADVSAPQVRPHTIPFFTLAYFIPDDSAAMRNRRLYHGLGANPTQTSSS